MRQKTTWHKPITADEIGVRLNSVEDEGKIEEINSFNKNRYGYPQEVEGPENITYRPVEGRNAVETAWMRKVNAIPNQPTLKFSDEAIALRKSEIEEIEAKEERRQKVLKRTWSAETSELMHSFK